MIWELGLGWDEGGKQAGSPAVWSGLLVGRHGPEPRARAVHLCCLTVGPIPTPWILLSVAWLTPTPLTHVFLFQLKDNKVFNVPVAVIAGNRPNYLYR